MKLLSPSNHSPGSAFLSSVLPDLLVLLLLSGTKGASQHVGCSLLLCLCKIINWLDLKGAPYFFTTQSPSLVLGLTTRAADGAQDGRCLRAGVAPPSVPQSINWVLGEELLSPSMATAHLWDCPQLCPIVVFSSALFHCSIAPNSAIGGIVHSSTSMEFSPALPTCGIFPSSIQLWVCLQFCSVKGLSPALPNCDTVPSSAQLWDCPLLFPIVGLSPVLHCCGFVPSSAQLWNCPELCPLWDYPQLRLFPALPSNGIAPSSALMLSHLPRRY